MNKKINYIIVLVSSVFIIIICVIAYITSSQNTSLAAGNELYMGSGSGILIIYGNKEVADDEEYWKIFNLLKESRFEETRDSLDRLLNQPLTSSSKRAILQNMLGIVATFEDKFDEANELFLDALEAFEGSEEEKRAFCAAVNNNLGHMYYWFGPKENIMPYYAKALELADRKNDQLVIRSNSLASELSLAPANSTELVYYDIIERCKQILKEEKKLYGSYQIAGSWIFSTISNSYSNMHKYKKAEIALQKAMKITLYTSNSELEKSGIYRCQGINYRRLGNYSEAEKKLD